MPIWILPYLIYLIGATGWSLEQRKLAQVSRIPLVLIPGLVLMLVVYPIVLAVALWQGNFYFDYSAQGLLLLVLASTALAFANVKMFAINKHVDATQWIIIMNLNTPMVVILALLTLGESMTGTQITGTVLLLAGAMLVALQRVDKRSFRINEYTGVLAMSAFFVGVGLVLQKAALSHMSISVFMIFGWGLEFVLTLLFAHKSLTYIAQITKPEWREIIRAGIFRAGLAVGYLLALSWSGSVALMASATTFRIPLVFVASYFILHERDHLKRKLIGVIIATIGLLLL